tara:strand:+ start:7561 stop:7959 length:399 start_codon:yes stop_codon:yes gene_type:complete
MKPFIALAAASTLALGVAPASAESPAERAEARLAERLEGRTAGEAKNCITTMNSNRLEVVERVGLVYERGDTIWVARTTTPNQLRFDDIPIIERFGSQLCRQDVIRTVDRSTGSFTGAVFLEKFVPYTRTSG